MAYAMHKNRSAGVEFIDITAAFASVMRCIALPADDADDAAWVELLMQAGFDREEAIATVGLACNALRWSATGADPHFMALLVEAHPSTWFSIEGLKEKLIQITKNQKADEIYLRADKTVAYGMVVYVMSEIKGAGIEKLGMITDPVDDTENDRKKQS